MFVSSGFRSATRSPGMRNRHAKRPVATTPDKLLIAGSTERPGDAMNERPQKMLLVHVQKHFTARVSEWILAAILLSWGVVLLMPAETFAARPDQYASLTRIASEDAWGWFCAGFGALRLVALVVNGAWVPPTYHLRSLTSFFSCFFWFQISLGFVASETLSTGAAVYPWLLVLDLICCYRTASDLRAGRGK